MESNMNSLDTVVAYNLERRNDVLTAALIKAREALQSAKRGGSFKHPQIGQNIDEALTSINSVLGE